MQKSRTGLGQVSSIIKLAQQRMGDHEDAAKERRRVDKIFNTVYRHAISHGQSHRRALKYCLNVYKEQAPAWSRKIVIQAINAEAPVKINRTVLRKLISEALLEEGIINYVPRPTQEKSFSGEGEVIAPDFGASSPDQPDQTFVNALYAIKGQIEELVIQMEYMSPAQKSYLGAMTDMLSDAISDEEKIDGTPEDFDDIDDIEDYPEEEAGAAAFLRRMGSTRRKFQEPTDDED